MAKILVTDAQDRCGLAAVRCLGIAGHDVTAASIGRRGVGLWSRYCRARRLLPDPRVSLDAFARELGRILREDPHDVLLAGRDETVYALARHRDQIGDQVRTGLPERDAVEHGLNKETLAAEAAKVGLPPPDQRLCEGVAAALDAAREFGFPLLVKPVRTVFERGDRVDRHPSRWVQSEPELIRIAEERDSFVVQRFVPGPVVSFGGFAGPDGLGGAVVARYLRTWPPLAGRASCSQTIVPPRELLEQTQALVSAIGWTGIFELELIERSDGRLQAIDFNPRPYGSIALARAAGVPLITMWCESLMGESRPLAVAPPGVRYRLEESELRNVAYRLGRGEYRAAASVIRPRRRTVHAYAKLRDPVPGLLHGASVTRGLFRSTTE